ncbi:hypothetical protein ACQP2U_43065 (plasmid) [Nocardia sp. CA-084685]|uniref:hypothetical protein n=1 Tax=Nocardia sp. CA-084685 TaxID=3239970 RepID=UPI003D981BC3
MDRDPSRIRAMSTGSEGGSMAINPGRSLISDLVAADTIEAERRRDPDRWRRCLVREDALAADIVARVWGISPPLLWQILAVSLIAQRLQDGEPTPKNAADPLREPLELMIDEEWRTRSRASRSPS